MTKNLFFLLSLFVVKSICQGQAHRTTYQCPPCQSPCDRLTFEAPGPCPSCRMPLVRQEAPPEKNGKRLSIEPGSGDFPIAGGAGHPTKQIRIYYHQPAHFSADSPILLVIPGSGRNAADYRDAWIKASEKFGVLILSPSYPEESYGIEEYQFGGLLYDTNLQTCITYKANTNLVYLDEDRFRCKISAKPEEWIFNDFDRIFETVVSTLGSRQTSYDVFGHSAGGQILHRLVLFHPGSKANRIIASNAGSYTLPDFNLSLPFGLKDTGVDNQGLASSFQRELVLLLGELDNANESRGTLLRSPTQDQQGLHRLERGVFFYQQAKEKARALNRGFHWKLEVVPKTGHDYRKMSEAAAAYLYGIPK